MNYRLTELKVLLFLLLLSAVSCQRPMYDEEDDEDGVLRLNGVLKIATNGRNFLCGEQSKVVSVYRNITLLSPLNRLPLAMPPD